MRTETAMLPKMMLGGIGQLRIIHARRCLVDNGLLKAEDGSGTSGGGFNAAMAIWPFTMLSQELRPRAAKPLSSSEANESTSFALFRLRRTKLHWSDLAHGKGVGHEIVFLGITI